MTAAVATHEADRVLEVLVAGNLNVLTPPERLSYYNRVCDSLNLNPMTQPFAFITLNGKLTLYALKGCTDQLRAIRGVSLRTETQQQGDMYVVTATAIDANGREDSDIGVVSTKGLSGEALANAMMKATTKAKRRVTLSVCGLGMLDETEIADIPASAKRPPVVMPQARIAAPTEPEIDYSTGEIIDAETTSQPAPAAAPKSPPTQQPASDQVATARDIEMFRAKVDELGFEDKDALKFAEWESFEGHTRAELNGLYRGLRDNKKPQESLL